MLTIRRVSWYTKSFLQKHTQLIVASMITGILFFIFLPHIVRVLPTLKHTDYIGRVGHFPLSQLPRDIQEKVSFGLMKTFEDGEVVPALAASYRVEENGKAYRFTLKPKVYWQDGKQVTPADVNYAFSDTQIARSQNDILFRITAKKQDATAQEPVLPVSFLSIVSQPLFRQIETRNLFFQVRKQLIGLGDYKISALDETGGAVKEITLDSNKDRLIYRFFPTEHSAIVGFKRGEVDVLEELLDPEDLNQSRTVSITPNVHTDQFVGIFFNLNYKDGENVVYGQRQLRQALNYAIEKPATGRIYSPINKKSWAYINDESDIEHYDKDMKMAADLLVKAETPTKLNIELQTTSLYSDVADKIKQQWEELGRIASANCHKDSSIPTDQCQNKEISVNVRINNFPNTQDYQVMLIGQQIAKDPDQYGLWHSTQGTNTTHFKNAKVDKLLEDARRSTNKEERKLFYEEFQRIIVRESPVIFLQPVTTYTIERKPVL